jgi:broad specificity phosphatase PhoE
MSTELILIRHGYTVRVNGDYFHAPLTQLGQEQAEQTGQYFRASENHLDGLYSSPLRRTQETAHIIGAQIGLDPQFRPGIQEVMFLELPIRWPIVRRVSKVLLDIVAKHPDQRIAVIAHAGVISASLSWYLPENRWRWWRTTVSNCSLTRFKVEGNRAELLAINDVRHLSPVIVTTQPPTATVEVAKEVHPAEKALVFERPPEVDKKSL